MSPYSLPTPAQDAEHELIDRHAASLHRLLCDMPADSTMTLHAWRDSGGMCFGAAVEGRKLTRAGIEVGTYTSAIDADALREDIEFAVQQL